MPPTTPETVPFSLPPISVNIIAEALQQMPWRVADPVLKDLQAQLDAHLARRQDPDPAPRAAAE